MRVSVGQRSDRPRAPYEIREAVELYARESGRTAKVIFIPVVGWMARFSRRPNDPMLELKQKGRVEEITEDVYFHVHIRDYDPQRHPAINPPRGDRPQVFVPLDILQMGASGVREFLDRGNTWSGRGQFDSHEDRLRQAQEANREGRRSVREAARLRVRDRVKERWRRIKQLPFLGWTRSREK